MDIIYFKFTSVIGVSLILSSPYFLQRFFETYEIKHVL